MAVKKQNSPFQDRVTLRFEFAEVTADTTLRLFKTLKDFQIDRVDLMVPAGLATDASNYFNLKVVKGAGPTVMANWSTLTGAQGTLTADTYHTMVLATSVDDTRAAADAVVSLLLDETGTATLPAGHIVIHGRYRS